MKRLITAALAAFFMAAPANANPVMLEYIDWITENSDLEYNGEPLPELKHYSHEVLQIMYYGEEDYIRYSEMDGVQLAEIMALYDDNVIYLREGTDYASWDAAPIMVHELVHYLQEVNGITSDCAPELEPQAYEIHLNWMDAHNHEGIRPDRLFLALLTMACDNPELRR